MVKAHVIRLYPTKTQERFFKQSCGVARYAYNWALQRWNEMYEAGEKPSAYTLIKELNRIKRTEYGWMLDVGKCSPQYAIHNLEAGFKAFFKKNANRPKFHKKGIKDSFITVENWQGFKQKDFKIWVARLGWVKCAENLRFKGKVNNVTIKRQANYWFAVVNIQLNEAPIISENQAIVGVDLGIKSMAVTSEGKVYENPKALKKALSLLKVRQQSLSRKQKGSNNRNKAKLKVAKMHYKVSCIRKDAIHKATTDIVNNAGVIVIENLNVKGMVKNHKLAQSIADVSFGEFRRQIEYKAAWQGKKVIIADTFFASSKTCSCCGHVKKELKLSERIFKCESCGISLDRDLNAAKNLANLGTTERLSGSKACGVGRSSKETQRWPTVKQEVNHCLTKYNELCV